MRFRIWIESESVRILQLEKWPGTPPYCVRYDPEFNTIGGRFKMDELTRMKLLRSELALAAQRLAEEGVPVEGGGEEGAGEEAEEKPKKRGHKRLEVEVEEPPDLDELIEREKRSEG